MEVEPSLFRKLPVEFPASCVAHRTSKRSASASQRGRGGVLLLHAGERFGAREPRAAVGGAGGGDHQGMRRSKWGGNEKVKDTMYPYAFGIKPTGMSPQW